MGVMYNKGSYKTKWLQNEWMRMEYISHFPQRHKSAEAWPLSSVAPPTFEGRHSNLLWSLVPSTCLVMVHILLRRFLAVNLLKPLLERSSSTLL